MKRRTVVSMEQALSLSYATLRFVQLGWRVIRLEATPSGEALPGDPNRYIGEVVAGEDRRQEHGEAERVGPRLRGGLDHGRWSTEKIFDLFRIGMRVEIFTLQDFMELLLDQALSGTWRSGRLSGSWWLESKPRPPGR